MKITLLAFIGTWIAFALVFFCYVKPLADKVDKLKTKVILLENRQ